MFTTWFRIAEACPRCGLALERHEPGYQVGAYMFAIVAAELVFIAIFVGVLLVTWPAPPWDVLTYGGGALMVGLPIIFYPYSKTLFLAFDLLFRPAPPEPTDPP